jgi:Leucine-rich repeat (LRR) protein/serine/threonine protein kinase
VELIRQYIKGKSLGVDSINQVVGHNGCAPIHEAAVGGHPDVIKLLCQEITGIDVNIRTAEGPASTALHLASQRGHPSVIIALAECGANLHAVDRCWRTATDIALEFQHPSVVHVLNMFEVVLDCESENLTRLEKLLIQCKSYQPNLSDTLHDWTQSMLNQSLLKAAFIGNRRIVNMLIKHGANNFQQCLDSTNQNNHITAFIYLCKSIIEEDSTAIDIILANKDDMVEHLDRYQDLIMHRAILAPLLQNGKVDFKTLIQVALLYGKIGIAGIIIRHSSYHPSTGCVDWHDLDLTFVDTTWLNDITNLTYMGLSSNKLRSVPDVALGFRSLRKLEIHHNKISQLPGELFSIPSIQIIDASFNNISSIPELIRRHVSPNLEQLNLSKNKLNELPAFLGDSQIKTLDVSFNRLNSVPNCILQMRRLHTLNLSHNFGIENVPCQLGSLRNLVLLSLDGLPYIRNIPSKTKSMPLQFLKSRAQNLHAFSHFDVIVVGTSEPHSACHDSIYTSVLTHSKIKDFTCLKMHSTAQFLQFQSTFSLSCSVYVLVWDCQNRQPIDDLLCHILHLVTYSPRSPVIIAACSSDIVTAELNNWVEHQLESCLWKEFNNHITLVKLTLDREALVGVKNSIRHLLEVIDNQGATVAMETIIPHSYFMLLDYFGEESKRLVNGDHLPILNEWEVWELIRSSPFHDLAGHKELSLVASFLTAVGLLIVLPTNRSDQLNHYVLNRQYFLNVVSGLLKRRQNQSIPTGLYPIEVICDYLDFTTTTHPSVLPYPLYLYANQVGLAIPTGSHEALIPAMFSASRVNKDFVKQYEVKRIYMFRLTPVSLWPKLISHFLVNMKFVMTALSLDCNGEPLNNVIYHDDVSPEEMGNWSYWKTGMVVWLYPSTLLFSIEAINPLHEPHYSEGLEICVSKNGIGLRAMNLVMTTVNSLIQNWYPDLWSTVKISVSCPYCSEVFFPIETCIQALCDKAPLTCKGVKLNPSNLIPDFCQSEHSGDDFILVGKGNMSFNFQDKSTCLSSAPLESVFKGQYGHMPVSLKPFPPPNSREEPGLPILNFWHELSILRYVAQRQRCPYIIETIVAFTDPLTLVFPCATFCSLEEVILESGITLIPLLRMRMVYQLASALEMLHSVNVVHRNVCLANILVFSLSLDDHVNIKLGGFSNSCLELHRGVCLGANATFPAPEMSRSYYYEYDQRVDVFSFAFTSYEIITRKKLKCRQGIRLQTALLNSDRPSLNPLRELAPYFMPLIERCWDNEPTKRPFFIEIVRHFRDPLNILTREGLCVDQNNEYNSAAVRYTRQPNGSYSCKVYICSSILSNMDTTVLSCLSIPGLEIENTISLPSKYIICMCCTSDYLWVSFQHRFVRIYSPLTLEFIKEIRMDSHVLVMSAGPDAIYLGKEDGEILMYNLAQPSPLNAVAKSHVVSYQQPIRSLHVTDDSIVCCTKRSFIRIHPQTLLVEQEFPIVSETEVKCAVIAINRNDDREYLWVGFRRKQEIVVFDAVGSHAKFGINCSSLFIALNSDIWVTCMLVVLDTVWVGLNTGYVLVFAAYSDDPLLLSYMKVHKDNVRSLLLLQPSYWTPKSQYSFDDFVNSDSSDDANDAERSFLSRSLNFESFPMPCVVSLLTCGQGIDVKIPEVGTDGVVMSIRDDSTSGLFVTRLNCPHSLAMKKVECQAQRPPKPYMEASYEGDIRSIYTSISQQRGLSDPYSSVLGATTATTPDQPIEESTYTGSRSHSQVSHVKTRSQSRGSPSHTRTLTSQSRGSPSHPQAVATRRATFHNHIDSDEEGSDELVRMNSPSDKSSTLPAPAVCCKVRPLGSIFPSDDTDSSLEPDPVKPASNIIPSTNNTK